MIKVLNLKIIFWGRDAIWKERLPFDLLLGGHWIDQSLCVHLYLSVPIDIKKSQEQVKSWFVNFNTFVITARPIEICRNALIMKLFCVYLLKNISLLKHFYLEHTCLWEEDYGYIIGNEVILCPEIHRKGGCYFQIM